MAKKATGNKKGLQAFEVHQQWREDGVPDAVTYHEAWNLTGGLVGKQHDNQTPMRTVMVAIKYVDKGGSLKDYLLLKAGN